MREVLAEQRRGTMNRNTPTLTCLYIHACPHTRIFATLPAHMHTAHTIKGGGGEPFGKSRSSGINNSEPCPVYLILKKI